MYCKKCGNQLSDGAKFCDSCGAPVETINQQQTQQTQQNSYAQQNYQPQYQQPMYVQKEQNIMAILGLVFAFLFPPVGLGLSIAGFKKSKTLYDEGRSISLAGIIVSSIYLGLCVLIIIPVIIIWVSVWSYAGSYYSAQFLSQILGIVASIL